MIIVSLRHHPSFRCTPIAFVAASTLLAQAGHGYMRQSSQTRCGGTALRSGSRSLQRYCGPGVQRRQAGSLGGPGLPRLMA